MDDMTPNRTRAEQSRQLAYTIASLLNYTAISHQDADNFDAVVSEIEQALDEADKVAYERGQRDALNSQKCKDCGCTWEACCCNPIREMEARKEGTLAGLEQAAQVAEKRGEHDWEYIVSDIRDKAKELGDAK